jgi:glycosyltransferase involved in cell wall biosynthesis
MAACWRSLRNKGVDCHVICASQKASTADPPFEESLLEGLSYQILSSNDSQLRSHVESEVYRLRPEVIAIAGWANPCFRTILRKNFEFPIKKVLCFDNPFRGDLRQTFGRVWFRTMLKHIHRIAVTGERSFQLAKFLGAPEEKIFRGVYGVDGVKLERANQIREKSAWPRRFVFVGRLDKRKGVDLLLEAYSIFKENTTTDWELAVAGNGPLETIVRSRTDVISAGFTPPEALPEFLAKAGAFILPSRYDAWPLSLVEAAFSGLPIIASNACGSAVEILRHEYNGFNFSTGSVTDLAKAMFRVSRSEELLPLMGVRSARLAEPWSAEMWAERWNYELTSLVS